MTLDLLHEFANTEVFCLFHNCMWQYPDTLKSMSISSSCVNKPMDCPLTGLSVLVWSASTFSSASLSLSTRSTSTGTQLFASLSVLTLVLSQLKQDIFFDLLSKRTRWFLPPATSELNSFIQLSLKKIFGRGRRDAQLSGIRFLQFQSEQLSGHNKLGMFREEWVRSILFDRT